MNNPGNTTVHPAPAPQQKALWQRKRIRIFIGILIVLVLLGTSAWWVFFRSFVSTNDSRIAVNILRVAPVNVGGLIEKVNVDEGDYVKKGQVLVEIDHRIPEANLRKAQARLDLTRIEMERAEKLAPVGAMPQKDLDNARASFQVAQAEVRLAALTLENTVLKSPIDGIVIQRIAQPGNMLEPGQIALIISDVDHAWVNANIEETYVGRVRVGQPVFITIDEGGSLKGTVQEITAATAAQFSLLPAENAAGNFTKVVQKIPIKIALQAHPGKVLRAGQSVTIKILVR